MAQKEAAVYILDLGRSMSEKRNGRGQTNLEWALEFVWDKVTNTVLTGRKTSMLGVVGFRTDETDVAGVIDDPEGYSNVRVLSPIKQYLQPDIRALQDQLKPSSTDEGDMLSALAVAIQMIDSTTTGKTGNKLKFDRRIVIVTDGYGPLDVDDLSDIVAKIKEDDIAVTLLGVDFDDLEYGFKEEDKDEEKEKNESILKDFVSNCDGMFGTLAEAIDTLDIPRIKDTRPTPSYKGTLTLGDPTQYATAMTIDIERYPRTMIARPPTASAFVVRTDLGAGQASTQSSGTVMGDDQAENHGHLEAVRNQRVYQVDNPDEPGAKMNIEEDIEKGYVYGRTAVHISESDWNVTKLETFAGLEIIGFIPEDNFQRFLPMSRTNIILAQKANDKASLALSSLIHALHETACYAVARFVAKESRDPLIVLLTPYITPTCEGLVDVELPYAEDVRRYKFPSLTHRLTVSGRKITEHKDLPNEALQQAMSDYVDTMDLSEAGRDEDGNPCEYMQFEDTYSPLLHRINTIIRWRATHPVYDKLPDPPAILTRFSAPPSSVLDNANSKLTKLKSAADIKRVPPKQKGRGKRTREREKPLSGLDVDALLGNPKRVKIDQSNLIPSFKQALAATDDLDAIKSAADEMGKSVRTYISESVGESGYGRALEAIRVFREEMTDMEEPEIYNDFIRELKGDILGGKLKGDRREMWWRIRGCKYGLVDQRRSVMSDVTEEEADEFYRST